MGTSLMCHRFGVRWSCETWIGDVKVLWCFLGSFCLSWGTFWPYFGRLGTLVGFILGLLGLSWGLLGSLFGLSWPKLPQDSEKIDFLNLSSGSWLKLGAKNQ